jgi:hypothetical protein
MHRPMCYSFFELQSRSSNGISVFANCYGAEYLCASPGWFYDRTAKAIFCATVSATIKEFSWKISTISAGVKLSTTLAGGEGRDRMRLQRYEYCGADKIISYL